MLGRGEGDRGRGEEGGDKGYLLSEGEKVSPLSTEEGLTGGKDMPGERQRPRLIVPWGCGGAGQQGWTSREIAAGW